MRAADPDARVVMALSEQLRYRRLAAEIQDSLTGDALRSVATGVGGRAPRCSYVKQPVEAALLWRLSQSMAGLLEDR